MAYVHLIEQIVLAVILLENDVQNAIIYMIGIKTNLHKGLEWQTTIKIEWILTRFKINSCSISYFFVIEN